MKQTPAHEAPNAQLLAALPAGLGRVVEIGCSTGALAAAYRVRNPSADYVGVEIDPDYAQAARDRCSSVIAGDIESFSDSAFQALFPLDCLVLGDVLEHLYDPWRLLRRARGHIGAGGLVAACIPNMQHWTVQARLAIGDLEYEDDGLLDRTHIRWFTRGTIVKLFADSGFKVESITPRIIDELDRARVLPAIGALSRAVGRDGDLAMRDATPIQYVVLAKPA